MLTRKDIVSKLAERAGISKKSAGLYVDILVNIFENACLNDGGVQITGVVTIGVKTNKSRTIINPATKQPMQTSETKSLSIKTGKLLKEKLND